MHKHISSISDWRNHVSSVEESITFFSNVDSYKHWHNSQYPSNVRQIFSTWTPRYNNDPFVSYFYWGGLQRAIYIILEEMDRKFFSLPKELAVSKVIKDFENFSLGPMPEEFQVSVSKMHDLGKLPINIFALDEGTKVPYRVSTLAMWNSYDFRWLTNFLETWLSYEIWHSSDILSRAMFYRNKFDEYARITSDNEVMTGYQGHDFSMRGMSYSTGAHTAGAMMALVFQGSDNTMARHILNKYYFAGEQNENNIITGSVPATEHSVTCCSRKEDEIDNVKRLLTEVHPKGILSYVSDTYDFWDFVSNLGHLKEILEKRDGKLVIRPDSCPKGKTPYHILCGDPDAKGLAKVGLQQALFDTFGFTINSKGYKVNWPKIGVIYGEAITPKVQAEILEGYEKRGWSTGIENIVLGLGSYGLQCTTRDTHGQAFKSSAMILDSGEIVPIFKQVLTDPSKASPRGLVKVVYDSNGNLTNLDNIMNFDTWLEDNELKARVVNGEIKNLTSYADIRENLGF